MRWQIGVIGSGGAADRLHLPALARIPEAKVIALADNDASRLNRMADKWRIERRYHDYHELIGNAAVNVVLIAVPAPLHHAIFLAATGSGKHSYIEKPLAMNLDEADRMLAARVSSSAQAAVGFNLRSHRLARQARGLVREGALGSILAIRTVWVGGLQQRPDWQRQRAAGGGVLYELGVHHFDLWRFLLDTEVSHVEALNASEQPDDANVMVTARLASGALASSMLALEGLAAHDVEIIGESASLRFSLYRADSLETQPAGRLGQLKQWLGRLPDAMKATRLGGDYLDSYRRHWLCFLAAISGGESPATLEDGRESLRVALAAMESMDRRTG